MTSKRKVLFLCTANACRSQMAEAILRHLGGDRFEAFSAGSHPVGFVHPLAIETMRRMNIPMDSHASKSWDDFANTSMDVVITVCDDAAAETCPTWPGAPLAVHWPLPDPAQHFGNEAERREFAHRVAERLRLRIQGLVDFDWAQDRDTLRQRLQYLAEI